MKRTIIVIFILLCNSFYGQVDSEIKIFHRLVIFNSDNKVMVVKEIIDNPKDLLGGTLRQFKEDDGRKTEIIEPFYSL